MAFFADLSVVSLLWKGLALVGLTLAGIGLLRSAHVDRNPRLAAAREARRPAYVSPHARPLPKQVEAPRLTAGADLGRLASVIDQARDHIQAIEGATVSASRQIDGAELALNRLLQDIAGVMPAVIAPSVVPRRSFTAPADAPSTTPSARAA